MYFYLREKVSDLNIGNDVKNLIISELKKNGVIEENKEPSQTNIDDICISSKGVKYNRSTLMKYLCQKGLIASQKNIDAVAENFKCVEKNKEYTDENDEQEKKAPDNIIEGMTDDEMMAYMNARLLIYMNKLCSNINHSYMEYTVASVSDTSTGATDISKLLEMINTHAIKGWHVKQIFMNELGVESSGVGIGGFSVSTNATIDEAVILFERPANYNL